MRALLATAAVLLAGNAPSLDEVRARVEKTPKDVEAFIVRRAGCNHFLGEYPYDRERAAELNRAIRELRCDGLDRDGRNLRNTYRNNPEILQLLDETADALGW